MQPPLTARSLRRALAGVSVVPFVGLVVAESVHAQAVLHEYVGAPPTQGLGGIVASISDANGDDVDDYVTRNLAPQGSFTAATVLVIDGRKGVPLAFLPDKNLLGVIGDVDADGTRDLVVGPSPLGTTGPLRVVSGSDFSTLHVVASIGGPPIEVANADGDPVPDYALAGPYAIAICAGADGALIRTIGYPNTSGTLYYSDAIGDLNGDGFTDFVAVGSTFTGPMTLFLLSGADGSKLKELAMTSWPGPLSPTTVGDVNMDSILDFALPGNPVEIRSGSELSVLLTISAPQGSTSFGSTVEPAGDVDSDGFPDLLVADGANLPGPGQLGTVWLFSGRDGTLLASVSGTSAAPLGQVVSGDVDVNGDGLLDLLCGRPTHFVGGVQNVGSVLALSFADSPAIAYCTAKINSQGCVPFAHGLGIASLNGADDFWVVAGNTIPQQFGLLVWSQSPAALPFGGGTLCVGSPLTRTPGQFSGGSAPCSGALAFHFSQQYLGDQGLGIGSSVYCQYWYRDPALPPPSNIGLTDGVVFAVSP